MDEAYLIHDIVDVPFFLGTTYGTPTPQVNIQVLTIGWGDPSSVLVTLFLTSNEEFMEFRLVLPQAQLKFRLW